MPIQMFGAALGTAAAMRSKSSPAARFEKVSTRMVPGSIPSWTNETTRFTKVRVLPVPGPAWSWKAEPRWPAAASCEGSGLTPCPHWLRLRWRCVRKQESVEKLLAHKVLR